MLRKKEYSSGSYLWKCPVELASEMSDVKEEDFVERSVGESPEDYKQNI